MANTPASGTNTILYPTIVGAQQCWYDDCSEDNDDDDEGGMTAATARALGGRVRDGTLMGTGGTIRATTAKWTT